MGLLRTWRRKRAARLLLGELLGRDRYECVEKTVDDMVVEAWLFEQHGDVDMAKKVRGWVAMERDSEAPRPSTSRRGY